MVEVPDWEFDLIREALESLVARGLAERVDDDTYALTAKGIEVQKTTFDPVPGQYYGHA